MTFRAFRIFEQGGQSAGRLVDTTLDELDPGDVVIRVYYSSINYKDALAATGAGKVVRRFPCVGGIDAAGKVEKSRTPYFKPGDEVIVTGYGMGVDHDGGYSRYVRVPTDWVVPLPKGLSLFQSMALGTAGLTAALCIQRLEQNELKPQNGKVLVTGATGGVGSLAIPMLAHLGYHVVALTGKEEEYEFLRGLGAAEVMARSDIDLSDTRPLGKALWAGALDAVGGNMLSWLTRHMQQNGAIASFGNAGGAELNTSVYPFILRGVKLLGIDSASTNMGLRRAMWRRLADELLPPQLDIMVRSISFEELPAQFEQILQGRSRGRVVVRID
jgi:acrylyl-CoA reductase (NADPH)